MNGKQLTLFNMKSTGIELTQEQRQSRVEALMLKQDYEHISSQQLKDAAMLLLISVEILNPPEGWDIDRWRLMKAKPYKERLTMAHDLIELELDRLNNETNEVDAD